MSVYSRYYENEINFKAELHAMTNPLLKIKSTPKHYAGDEKYPFDAIDFSHKYGLSDCLGSVAKYIARAGKKEGNTALKDLEKALDYLQREIKHLEE